MNPQLNTRSTAYELESERKKRNENKEEFYKAIRKKARKKDWGVLGEWLDAF